MSRFQEIGLTWDDREYVVPANKVMGLIDVVLQEISLQEMSSENFNILKLRNAFTAALNYAGCKATREDVYFHLFDGKAGEHIAFVIASLNAMVVPPKAILPKTEKKPATRKKKKAKTS